MTHLGIIGGSGLYRLPGLERVQEVKLSTPFGSPSAPIVTGVIGDQQVAFLSRHGRGHTLGPTDVPFRANIHALKQLGVNRIVSVSAVGSLREALPPGSAALPDQIIDRTLRSGRSFFDRGVVAHVSIADPFCESLRQHIHNLSGRLPRPVVLSGTYICIEGPQFSTRAESCMYRDLGASVIGMTAMPEARLAREAGICYALVAMVTDYDVWHESEDDVTVDVVLRVLESNARFGQELMRGIALSDIPPCTDGCAHALVDSVITDRSMIAADARARVGIFLDQPNE